jgi:hypothetical protein
LGPLIVTAETNDPARKKHLRLVTPRRLILGILLLIPAALVGVRAYEVLSTPSVGEPFDVEAFCAYRLPDAKNAFTHYRKVVALFVSEQKVLESNPSLKTQDFLDSENAALEDWTRAIPPVRDWVALNRRALDEWQRGADCDESLLVSPDQAATASVSAADSTVISLRNCSKLEGLEATRLVSEGHPAEAWACYRNLLRTGRHLAMHGTLMGSLVAVAELGVSGGVAWANQKSVNAELLRKAIRDVEAVDQMRAPPSDVIKFEYLALREFATKGMVLGMRTPAWVHYTGYPAQVGRTARLVTANLLTQADRPRYLRTAVHPGKLGLFEIDPAAAPDPRLRPPEEIERSTLTSALTVAKTLHPVAPEAASEIEICDPQSMTQSLHYAIQVNDTSQTRRFALLLALALQLHYREHGEFPASLDELVKNGYLKSIPPDPFGKGEPFRYRCEPGPRGAAVVWSVWIDGVDQGGIDLNGGLRVLAPGTSAAPSK